MKAWMKTHTVDRYLQPLRRQMLGAILENSSLLEIGCGTGDFMFQAASRLSHGLGLDADARLIQYAQRRNQRDGSTKLQFKVEELDKDFDPGKRYDWGVASLFFHVLPQALSLSILTSLKSYCDQVMVAAFTKPQNQKEEWMMWLDQRWSGHYRYYRQYAEQGYMEGLLSEAKIKIRRQESTFDPCIDLYFL